MQSEFNQRTFVNKTMNSEKNDMKKEQEKNGYPTW